MACSSPEVDSFHGSSPERNLFAGTWQEVAARGAALEDVEDSRIEKGSVKGQNLTPTVLRV